MTGLEHDQGIPLAGPAPEARETTALFSRLAPAFEAGAAEWGPVAAPAETAEAAGPPLEGRLRADTAEVSAEATSTTTRATIHQAEDVQPWVRRMPADHRTTT